MTESRGPTLLEIERDVADQQAPSGPVCDGQHSPRCARWLAVRWSRPQLWLPAVLIAAVGCDAPAPPQVTPRPVSAATSSAQPGSSSVTSAPVLAPSAPRPQRALSGRVEVAGVPTADATLYLLSPRPAVVAQATADLAGRYHLELPDDLELNGSQLAVEFGDALDVMELLELDTTSTVVDIVLSHDDITTVDVEIVSPDYAVPAGLELELALIREPRLARRTRATLSLIEAGANVDPGGTLATRHHIQVPGDTLHVPRGTWAIFVAHADQPPYLMYDATWLDGHAVPAWMPFELTQRTHQVRLRVEWQTD